MSFQAISWAYEQAGISPLAKFVLITIADGTNDGEPSRVSIEALTSLTLIDHAAVLECIHELSGAGKLFVCSLTDVFIEVELRLPAAPAKPARSTLCAGFLYVAEADGLTKIGITKDPQSRVRALVSASGKSVWLAKTFTFPSMQAARIVERQAHEHFSGRRSAGEWFKITPDEAVRHLKTIVGGR